MGWGLDLATFLSALAVYIDGNPLTQKVSIGGPDKRVGIIPGLSSGDTLPGGILKHNAYEIDSSLTRDDIALGNNRVLNTTLFQQIWEVADEMNNGVINDKVMTKVRQNRYEASVRDNPKFTFAPIGVLFFFADQFLYNTMPTALDNGEPGPATRETVAPFYGAKPTGKTTWEYVPEHLPKNWIRRARPLSIPEAVAAGIDTVTTAASKGQLPTGITQGDLTSPKAMVCAIKAVAIGQVPAFIAGLQGATSLLSSLSKLGGGC
jgi:Peroxidase, family 2